MIVKHNKKRNVALIYEQLIRYISRSLIEGEKEKAKIATQILNKHFQSGTELYKEFRLFNAMVRAEIDDEYTAQRILEEARKSAKDHDRKLLEEEKGKLISAINKKINDVNFFNIKVPEYRNLAIVQGLLNSWRSNSSSIQEIVEGEKKVIKILQEKKNIEPLFKASNVNNLSVKILKEKVTKKLSENLNPSQLKIVSLYTKEKFEDLVPLLREVKEDSLEKLKLLKEKSKNSVLLEKIDPVFGVINFLNESDVSGENISRFLVISKLVEELNNPDDLREE